MPAAPEKLPASLPAQLLRLGEQLRDEGVPVGTSELLDCFSALAQVSWTSQADFKEALAATLAKSPEDRRIFERVFDRFMFRAVEAQAIDPEMSEQIGEGAAASMQDLSASELEALREQIAAALAQGSQGALRDLALLAIAAFSREAEGSGVIGVDVQRIRRALGLRAEQQPEDPTRPAVSREALRRFEALLREELERAQARRAQRLP
ncbi:MAG: CoxE, partial [Solirubrobacteraceae bacterium]